MKASIILTTSVGAAGLAVLLAGPAAAQYGPEAAAAQASVPAAGQATAGFTRARTLALGVNRSYATRFDTPAAGPAPQPGPALIAASGDPSITWQFGPRIGVYTDGN